MFVMENSALKGEVSLAEAAGLLVQSSRILVIGTSGGGKSTLSQKIALQFDLQYVSSDKEIRWLPGWTVRDAEERRALEERFVSEERWVFDGTSVSTLDIRLAKADLVIWMRPNRFSALFNLAKRITRYYGRVRPDMAPGCPEPLPDFDFLCFIWTFEKHQSPLIIETLNSFPSRVPVVQITSNRHADDFMSAAVREKNWAN